MTDLQIALAMFGALIVIIMFGHPVAFTVGGISLLFGYAFWGGTGFYAMLSKSVFGVMDNYLYAAIPLFVFMGAILERSGVGEALYSAMHTVLGRLHGGLASATVVICTLFAASTGIIATSIVSMGLMALPAMVKRGYSKELATGAVMAGGTLGILIPPSIMLVVEGATAGLSIGKLFAGALFPGLILSSLYITMITVVCHFRPNMGPGLPPGDVAIPALHKVKLTITAIIPPIALIIAVLGSIFFGLASPTEAAGIGGLGSLIIALAYRRLNWNVIKEGSYETMKSCAMIMWILVGASCYAAIFLGLGGGEVIADMLLGLSVSPMTIVVLMLFVLFLLGMIMEWIAIALVTIPVFFPVVTALGFDPLWFAILFAVVLQTGFLSPPYGGALFILKGVAPKEISMAHIWRGAWMFIPLQLLGLTLCVAFPQIVLWLPSVLVK